MTSHIPSGDAWYHGKMSRRDAEKLLKEDGDFLVRKSTTNPGSYVLTGMHNGLAKHLLLVDPEGTVRRRSTGRYSLIKITD
uniref:SH2 domain-containing protein n=1 Tax=Labrus bergylta TaxID=56723 RepID=A0A3Q3FX63_9LABR